MQHDRIDYRGGEPFEIPCSASGCNIYQAENCW